MSKKLYVAKTGSDFAKGSEDEPLLTINKAASLALPGDTVIVHEGIYREEINDINSGLSESRRITFESAKNEKVTIKGSEEINDWRLVEGNIWKVEVPNQLFKTFNPFSVKLFGDWLEVDNDQALGQVYLNGHALFEVNAFDRLKNPQRVEKVFDYWTEKEVDFDYADLSTFLWYAEVDENSTTIYANFQNYNPNEELIEINVREHVFSPNQTHTNYITIRNFELAHAATKWSPPTAKQTGLIDTN